MTPGTASGAVPDAGVWAAPGRVNLIGEHTDYNDGFCLPFALPLQVTVAARRSAPGRWVARSSWASPAVEFTADGLAPGSVTGWGAYVAGVVWSMLDSGLDVPGAELEITSDLPSGSGLSSSAALECAVQRALLDLGGLSVPGREQALLAQRAENAYVGMPCGVMDQSAAVLCEDGHALFLDTRSGAVSQVPFDIASRGLAVLVVDTRSPHRLVDGEYAERRSSCEDAARQLGVAALRDATLPDLGVLPGLLRRRARHVVTENQRVLDTVALLSAGDVEAIGPLLTASHASLRDDFEVTVPRLDLAADTAVAAGAFGARMTGGGFGGCVIALVRSSGADEVAAAVAKAFDAAGFGAPETFLAVPSPGARRLS
ncbi:MAG: galactokinase [Cryptosporangiaceae bacterium]|nr:galactokinase [Cryptosporangiaceae bacterium]